MLHFGRPDGSKPPPTTVDTNSGMRRSGRTPPSRLSNWVRAESPGIVDRISVQQGQPIAKGAVLATLRFTGVQPDLSAARAQIAALFLPALGEGAAHWEDVPALLR